MFQVNANHATSIQRMLLGAYTPLKAPAFTRRMEDGDA